MTEQRSRPGCNPREYRKDKRLRTDITATISLLRARLEVVDARLQEFQRLPENDESQRRARLLQWQEQLGSGRDWPAEFPFVELPMELIH